MSETALPVSLTASPTVGLTRPTVSATSPAACSRRHGPGRVGTGGVISRSRTACGLLRRGGPATARRSVPGARGRNLHQAVGARDGRAWPLTENRSRLGCGHVIAAIPSPLDLLDLPFMRTALAELALLGVAGGLLGTWVVLRRLAFFSHAVGTATFPGLVIAEAAGITAQGAGLVAALLYAGGVDRAGRSGRAPGDE